MPEESRHLSWRHLPAQVLGSRIWTGKTPPRTKGTVWYGNFLQETKEVRGDPKGMTAMAISEALQLIVIGQGKVSRGIADSQGGFVADPGLVGNGTGAVPEQPPDPLLPRNPEKSRKVARPRPMDRGLNAGSGYLVQIRLELPLNIDDERWADRRTGQPACLPIQPRVGVPELDRPSAGGVFRSSSFLRLVSVKVSAFLPTDFREVGTEVVGSQLLSDLEYFLKEEWRMLREVPMRH